MARIAPTVMVGRPTSRAMMVELLLYAYANGNCSSRGIERECVEDVAYRVIAAEPSAGSLDDRGVPRAGTRPRWRSCSPGCWRYARGLGW